MLSFFFFFQVFGHFHLLCVWKDRQFSVRFSDNGVLKVHDTHVFPGILKVTRIQAREPAPWPIGLCPSHLAVLMFTYSTHLLTVKTKTMRSTTGKDECLSYRHCGGEIKKPLSFLEVLQECTGRQVGDPQELGGEWDSILGLQMHKKKCYHVWSGFLEKVENLYSTYSMWL